ncbi:hypothetical protein OC834_004683 [Tilletia horrida]|nr:hypothetical protein OC834_004683 [Tilletia horrida]
MSTLMPVHCRRSSTDSPPKARLSGNTPSLSERIAALQRRNASGPAGTSSPSSAGASSSSTPAAGAGAGTAGAASGSSSLLAPPGSASSAVKDRIARLQSKGDGETPLLPRSSFGAPAPNPEVSSHAVRQFPGAALSASHGATLRPQMTGGAWLNGMPANTSGAPLRPQMTGGMWGNQYYGAHAAVPLPRRGPSPTTPTRQQSQPIIHGGRDDAFAELDREAAEAAREREPSSGSSGSVQEGKLPSLPSAPEGSPPAPSSPRSTVPTSSASSTTTLPNLPEAPSDPPLVKVEPSPESLATAPNGQRREIEIGIRAPEDAEAQRKLEQLVSAADNIHIQPPEPASPSAASSGSQRTQQQFDRDPTLNNPLFQDITDDDDRLVAGDGFGTLTVLKRSRTGSSSVSDGLHGVGRAAVDALLDGSDDDEAPASPSGSPRRAGKDNAAAGVGARNALGSPVSPTSPDTRRGAGPGRKSGGSVSSATTHRSANRNGISHVDQLYANGETPASLPFGSPVRSGSSGYKDSPLMQSPVQGNYANGSGSAGGSGMVPSSSSSSSGFRIPGSDSMDSGVTVTSSSTKTLQDSSFASYSSSSHDRNLGGGALRRGSAASGDTFDSGSGSPTVSRRSGSVASIGRSGAGATRRSATMPVDPILEGEGSTVQGAPGSSGDHHGRDGSGGSGPGGAAGASAAGSGGTSANAAAARAREAIALARSKSQGGRLARPPPPGRTLTAAELDASDDDYEPGWASIISRK